MTSKKEKDRLLAKKQLANASHKRIWTHFTDLVNKNIFQNFITTIRKESMMLYDKDAKKYYFRSGVDQIDIQPEYFRKIEIFCEQNGLHYTDFGDMIVYYIEYDEVPTPYQLENAYDLYVVEDPTDRAKKKNNKYWQDSDDKFYPVSIRMNPSAGKNEMIDFINNNFSKLIAPRLKRSATPSNTIRVVRKRSQQERDDFILEYKNKPVEEIKELLEDTMKIFLSNSEIRAIIKRKTQN